MKEDRNFDEIADKFVENIYGSDKGQIRQVVLWQDLSSALSHIGRSESCQPDQTPLTILDAGGGVGQLSQRLAALGHNVTLCDISAQMLAHAQHAIQEQGLESRYRLIHSSAQSVGEHLEAPVDILLFHAVMEWLVDPKAVLDTLLTHVKPGGIASVMFYNHHGLVLKNVTCGNIPHVLKGMPYKKRFKLQPQHGIVPEQAYLWLEQAGFEILGRSGIRCFSDYISDRHYMGDYTLEDLIALEQQLCRQEPYLSLGRYIHVWAQRRVD